MASFQSDTIYNHLGSEGLCPDWPMGMTMCGCLHCSGGCLAASFLILESLYLATCPPPQPGLTSASAPRHCAGLPSLRWLLSFGCYRNLLWEQRVMRSRHLPSGVLSQRPWGYLRVLCIQDTQFVKQGTSRGIRHRKLIARLLDLLQHLGIS